MGNFLKKQGESQSLLAKRPITIEELSSRVDDLECTVKHIEEQIDSVKSMNDKFQSLAEETGFEIFLKKTIPPVKSAALKTEEDLSLTEGTAEEINLANHCSMAD